LHVLFLGRGHFDSFLPCLRFSLRGVVLLRLCAGGKLVVPGFNSALLSFFPEEGLEGILGDGLAMAPVTSFHGRMPQGLGDNLPFVRGAFLPVSFDAAFGRVPFLVEKVTGGPFPRLSADRLDFPRVGHIGAGFLVFLAQSRRPWRPQMPSSGRAANPPHLLIFLVGFFFDGDVSVEDFLE